MKWMSSPGPKRQVSDEEIIEAIKSVDEHFATTAEVAQRTELGRQRALTLLHPLHERGVIEGKKAGTCWCWWVR
jgi:DNA-binding IclR family transcriptional regulator